MNLTFPVPAAMAGDQLTAELVAAGFPEAFVYVAGDELVVGGVDDEQAALDVVNAHAPVAAPAAEPSPEQRIAALEAEVRGMKDRAAAAVVSGDAAKVRDAIKGAG